MTWVISGILRIKVLFILKVEKFSNHNCGNDLMNDLTAPPHDRKKIKTFHQGSLGLGSIMRSLCRGLVGTYPLPMFKTIIFMVRLKLFLHVSYQFFKVETFFCMYVFVCILIGWKPCFNLECVTVARSRDQKTSGLWRRTCSQFSASKRGRWRRMFW